MFRGQIFLFRRKLKILKNTLPQTKNIIRVGDPNLSPLPYRSVPYRPFPSTVALLGKNHGTDSWCRTCKNRFLGIYIWINFVFKFSFCFYFLKYSFKDQKISFKKKFCLNLVRVHNIINYHFYKNRYFFNFYS